jgi:protoheme ferro-lyase
MGKFIKFLLITAGSISLLVFISSFTNKQDDMNYRKYMHQDKALKGKVGVLVTGNGQPEFYEFEYYNKYLNQIFNAAFPPILKPVILADHGIVLLDPTHVTASDEFKPETLMDCYGKTKNKEGVPYTELAYKWVAPRKADSPGHFLIEEKNDLVDLVEKVSAKIAGAYYPKMPGNRIPLQPQHIEIFKDVEKMLAKEFPGVPMRWAWSMYPETVEKAVDELIHEKVDTIVACDIFPAYSALEQFNTLFVEIKDAVAERAKIIYTPFQGAYPSYRTAFVAMAEDEVLKLPKQEKKLIVLTRHGFPPTPGDPFPELARVYYNNLKKEVEQAIQGTNTLVIYADTDFAGEDMDPKHNRLGSFEAFEMGLEEGYDHMIFILVDFVSETTDSIFAMRYETFEKAHFAYDKQVPYADFTKPFRSEFTEGKTRVVVAGTPVGNRYRPHIAQGVFDSIATVLRGQPWPLLLLEEEKKKEGMF